MTDACLDRLVSGSSACYEDQLLLKEVNRSS